MSNTHETVSISAKIGIKILRIIPIYPHTKTAQQITDALAQDGMPREKRNIQKILNALCEEFTELECDQTGKTYTYCWGTRSKGLNLPFMTVQESLLFMLAQQQLRPLLPETLKPTLQHLVERAYSNLKPHQTTSKGNEAETQKALAWMSKVRVVSQTQPLLPPKIRDDVFEAVTTALYHNHYLIIDYTNAKDEFKKDKRIKPLGLAQQGNSLYLVCIFDGYDAPRTLALHRIGYAHNTKISFERPDNFSLEQYDLDGKFAFGDGQKMKLILRVNTWLAKILTETKLAEDQEIKKIDEDEFEIIATVMDTLQLDWWLNSFDSAIYNIRKT